MKTSTLYYEKQQFRQWFLWLFLFGLNGFILYKIIICKDYGTAKNWYELFPLLIIFGLTLFIWFVKLETKINDEGIYISYFPLLLKTKFYSWEIIEKVAIKKYNPIMDYGGWGVRLDAYNVSGNIGVQLYFKSGDLLLIGTQKPDEIKKLLQIKKILYEK